MHRLFHRLVILFLLGSMTLFSGAPAVAGSLRVGSDISYAPLEFYTPHAHQMTGFDIDLAKALGKQLGSDVQISNHTFDDLLHAVATGRFDLAISALSDTRKREGVVDFIDYMLAGSGMLVPAGNPKRVFELGALCGLRVDVQKGTSQEVALKAETKNCVAVHLGPMHLSSFATDDQAFSFFESGKSDVHVTDYPVISYLARTMGAGTKYEVAGRQFDVVPYGIAIAKTNVALRASVQHALAALISNGTYDALLKKWGLNQGALRSTPLDAGTLFEK